jgi:hypothetical protein
MRRLAFAALLAGFGGFEVWNHRTGVRSLVAGGLAPVAIPPLWRDSLVAPFWLGIAGFWLPRGHACQVAALGWSAHVLARRALSREPV